MRPSPLLLVSCDALLLPLQPVTSVPREHSVHSGAGGGRHCAKLQYAG